MDNSISKEWRRFSSNLKKNIKETKERKQTDEDLLDLMLHMLENSRLKIHSDRR